jgi:hypothetical protein
MKKCGGRLLKRWYSEFICHLEKTGKMFYDMHIHELEEINKKHRERRKNDKGS